MRTISLILVMIIIVLGCFSVPAYAAASSYPDIHASAVILMDSDSGRVLYEENMHEKRYPASITKIMTAIIALEEGDLDDTVTASLNAINSITLNSTHIGLRVGEKLTLEQMLYGLMIASANEGANAIAEHITGCVDLFIQQMNDRAKELGALNTNFTNTNGLPHDDHYTTAYDMAIITKHAMTIPAFREIVSTDYYEVPPTNRLNETRYFSNTNHLINRARATTAYNYYYPSAIGVKTGWTTRSQHTLVAAAKRNNIELITVVLDATKDDNHHYSYVDTLALFEYGFKHFDYQTIARPNQILDEIEVIDAKANQMVKLLASQPLQALLPKNIDMSQLDMEFELISPIQAPIEKGNILGFVTFHYNHKVLGTINVIADQDVEQEPIIVIKEQTLTFIASTTFKLIVGILVLIIILIVMLRIRHNKNTAYIMLGNGHKRKIKNFYKRK